MYLGKDLVAVSNHADTSSVSASRLVGGYSLEMTAKDTASLTEAAGLIPSGTSISITYLPGEGVDARVAASTLVRHLGFTPVPHISARRIPSEATLREYLQRLANDATIDRVFVIAGDLENPMGPYSDALSLMESGIFQEYGIAKIGFAGYPEGHPDISQDALWQALQQKVAYMANQGLPYEIATQFTFDAKPVLAWLEEVRARGITGRVRIGLPGPANVRTLLRFAARCGVGASSKVLTKYGLSITKLLGTAGPDKLIGAFTEQLEPHVHGDVQIHFYPFGGFKPTASWVHAFSKAS